MIAQIKHLFLSSKSTSEENILLYAFSLKTKIYKLEHVEQFRSSTYKILTLYYPLFYLNDKHKARHKTLVYMPY